MELKDYLLVFRKRWYQLILICIVVFVMLILLNASQPKEYQSQGEMVFKQLYEIIGVRLIEPVPIELRLKIVTSTPVTDKIVKLLEQRGFQTSKEILRSILRVEKGDTESSLVVKVIHTDPKLAKEVTNATIDAYVEYDVDDTISKLKVQEDLLRKDEESLSKEVQEVQKEIQTLMNDDFKKKGIVEPDVQSTILSNVLIDLERQRQMLLIDIRELDNKIKHLPEVERNSIVEMILNKNLSLSVGDPARQERLKKLQDKLEELKLRYKDAHPDILKLKEQIVDAKNELASGAFADIMSQSKDLVEKRLAIQAKADFLMEILTVVYNRLLEVSQSREKLLDRRGKLENLNKRYFTTLDSRKEAQRQLAVKKEEMTRMVTVSRAESASYIVRAKQITVPLMGFLSLVIAIAATFLIEYLQATVRTRLDVFNYLGTATIGAIPKIDVDLNLIKQTIKSPVSELFSRIGVYISSAALENRAKALLITSAKAGDGKTTVSSNIAISLARSGERVILIDADLRHGQQHHIFGLDNSKGFANLLQGELEAEEKIQKVLGKKEGVGLSSYIHQTSVENLGVICSGPVPVNPISLLKSNTTRNILSELKQMADIIIIDSPPLLGVIDAAIIASFADLTIVVIEEAGLKRHEASYIRNSLKQTNANVLGVIMNKAKYHMDETYYYYYYYRYRGYPSK